MESIGGITKKHAIVFQTQVMLGAQFGRVVRSDATQEDLMIACLRMGWNDAFRHTSENVKNDKESVLTVEENEWRAETVSEESKDKKHPAEYDDFICGNILNQELFLNTFREYACAESTDAKVQVVTKRFKKLQSHFKPYKALDGKKQLCFGHFQKMFNIAIKLYLCLYFCREELEIGVDKFRKDMIEQAAHADCPIDSIILGDLSEKTECAGYKGQKWSKYGTEGQPVKGYKDAQTAIAGLVGEGKCNLYHDFVAWKQKK